MKPGETFTVVANPESGFTLTSPTMTAHKEGVIVEDRFTLAQLMLTVLLPDSSWRLKITPKKSQTHPIAKAIKAKANRDAKKARKP